MPDPRFEDRAQLQFTIENILDRIGASVPPERVGAMVDELVRGRAIDRVLAEDRQPVHQDLEDLIRVVELGRMRSQPGELPAEHDNLQGVPRKFAEDMGGYQPFGVPATDVWDRQREGWSGYGWNQAERDLLGRSPEPMELSHGGRWASRADAEANLINSLVSRNPNSHLSHPRAGIVPIIDQFERERSRTHDEIGALNALSSADYPIGWAFSAANVLPEAGKVQRYEVEGDADKGPEYWRGPEDPSSEWTPKWAARNTYNWLSHYVPRARDTQFLDAELRRGEPFVPAGPYESKGDAFHTATQALRGSKGLTYDESVRRTDPWDQYPSYLASMGNYLVDEAKDASLPFPIGGAIKSVLTAGAKGGAKAAATTLGRSLLSEAGGEVMGHAQTGVPFAMAGGYKPPPVSSWLTPGNEARTDLPQESRDEFMARTDAASHGVTDNANRAGHLYGDINKTRSQLGVKPEPTWFEFFTKPGGIGLAGGLMAP